MRSTVRWPVVAALLVGASLVLSACGHAGGDPGGRVLGELRPVLSAVPSGSSMVKRQKGDSAWESGVCPDNPHSGWTEVYVGANFTTNLSHDAVVSDVNAVLVRHGWKRHDIVVTRSQGPVVHWWKHVATGHLADVFAFPVPAGSENWLLTASWEPPGFSLAGC